MLRIFISLLLKITSTFCESQSYLVLNENILTELLSVQMVWFGVLFIPCKIFQQAT